MNGAAEAGGKLEIQITESARELVVDALDVLAVVMEESVAHARADELELAQSRLAQARALREQLADAEGPVEVSGEEDLMVDVARAAASHGAYELDALLEELAGTHVPLTYHAVAQLRVRMAAASSTVETLIACEAQRDAT